MGWRGQGVGEKAEKKERRGRAWVNEGWWTFQIRPQRREGVDGGHGPSHTRLSTLHVSHTSERGTREKGDVGEKKREVRAALVCERERERDGRRADAPFSLKSQRAWRWR